MATVDVNAEVGSVSSQELRIIVREPDIPKAISAQVTAVQKHRKVLGEDDKSAQEWILEALPGVIARRIGPMLPADFELAEMQMKVTVEGKPFGIGVGGEVLVVLRRRSAE